MRKLLSRFRYHLLVFFAVLYGASDELHQLSTPGRHGQYTDVLIDAVGALLFIGAVWAYRSLRLRTTGGTPGK